MPVIQEASGWVKASRPFEAWKRYTIANGNLLAAGVAYFAFFSIFPALTLAFAVFGFILKDRPDIMQTLVDSVNEALPGMVKTADTPNGVISIEAPSSLTLTLTGIIAFVTLLLAGLGWVGALRTGIRGLFGLKASNDNVVLRRVRDLFTLVTLGIAILVSAVVTSAVGGWAGTIAGWLGLTGSGPIVGVLGFLLGVALDTAIMVILLRMLSRVPLPWHNVRDGAVLGALAITVLKLVGGFLVGHVTSNPILGAVAVSVGLLFWLNLMSRVVLLSAAWAANNVDVESLGPAGVGPTVDRLPPADAGPSPARLEEPTSGAAYAAAAQPPSTASAAHADQLGSSREKFSATTQPASRSVDRASIAAGAVLGAAAAAAVTGAKRLRRG